MKQEYLTLKELTNKLKISRSTIDRWRKEGLPFVKIGRGVRFDEVAVMTWIDNHKKEK